MILLLWFLSAAHLYEVDNPAMVELLKAVSGPEKTLVIVTLLYHLVSHLDWSFPHCHHHHSQCHISSGNLASHHLIIFTSTIIINTFTRLTAPAIQSNVKCWYFIRPSSLQDLTHFIVLFLQVQFLWRWFVNWFKTSQYSRLGIGFYHQGPWDCHPPNFVFTSFAFHFTYHKYNFRTFYEL